jgi:hypothetical protein
MARAKKQPAPKTVNPDDVARSLAKSVADGDIVNLRLLFWPFSPARTDSTEVYGDEKYAYLLPAAGESGAAFEEALKAVRQEATWAHVQRELAANRPAQLPAELVLLLGDNAVRTGKWTSAAQAYELLRIRRKMQEEFFVQGVAALGAGDVPRAVWAFRAGVGLGFDYSAFPEPLPRVPQYQTRALMMHGSYPARPEDCVALLEPELHAQVALDYLLNDSEAAGRLREVNFETRLKFLRELVRQSDPGWDAFAGQFAEACRLTHALGSRLQHAGGHQPETLAEEIEEQQAADPWGITRALLGRGLEDGAWWQYLKELAYEHPAAALFISRQLVGEHEILMPRLRADSPVAAALGLKGGEAPLVPARAP